MTLSTAPILILAQPHPIRDFAHEFKTFVASYSAQLPMMKHVVLLPAHQYNTLNELLHVIQ